MQQQFNSSHTVSPLPPDLICGHGVCVSTETAWREHFKRSLQQGDWGCVSPQELYHSRREHSLQTVQWQKLWLNGLVIHYRRDEMKEKWGTKYMLCSPVFLCFSWRGCRTRRILLPVKTLGNVASQLQGSSHSSRLTRPVISWLLFLCRLYLFSLGDVVGNRIQVKNTHCMWSHIATQRAAGDRVLP